MTDDASYDCLFHRRYLLPCEHLFQNQILYKFMPDDYWDRVALFFEECGFDIYEDHEELEVSRELAIEVTAPA